jgi:hypothetical protein
MKRKWLLGCGALLVVGLGISAYLLSPLVNVFFNMFYPEVDRGQCSFAVTQAKKAVLPSDMVQRVSGVQFDNERLLPITVSNAANLVELTSVTVKSDYLILDLAVQQDRSLVIYHYISNLYTIPIGNNDWQNIVFSPDRKKFVLMEIVGSGADHLRLCDTVAASQTAYLGSGLFPTFSPRGAILASSEQEGINLWDASTGAKLGFIGNCTSIISTASAIKFNSEETIGIFGCGRRVEIWEIQNSKIISTLDNEAGYITSVSFSADDKIIALADDNMIIRLWGIPVGD